MVILYVLSGLMGGVVAAGCGLVQSLPWYAVLGLYSAGGTTATILTAVLTGLVLPAFSKLAQGGSYGAATDFTRFARQRGEHSRQLIGFSDAH